MPTGVAVVGFIPNGLPAFHFPEVRINDIQTLIPVSFAAAIVAFSDTMANSRGFANRNHYRVDANQELLALGMSNIVAAAWNLCDFKAFKRMWQYRGVGALSAPCLQW